MNYTKEQNDILSNIILEKDKHYTINALAGTGKTFILEKLSYKFENEHPLKSSLMLSFSRADKLEAEKRFASTTVCKTSNALGYQAYRSLTHNNKPNLWTGKNRDCFKALKLPYKSDFKSFTSILGILKSNLIYSSRTNDKEFKTGKALTLSTFSEIALEHGFDFTPYTDLEAFELVDTALDISFDWAMGFFDKYPREGKNNTNHYIDFDDQIYIPLLLAEERFFPKYDIIFLDEAQDLALLQHELLRRVTQPWSNIIIVGDPNQAIYGFRGADSDSFSKLVEEYQTKSFPLSTNFRCDLSIIEEAKRIVPEILPMEGKPQGHVQTIAEETLLATDIPAGSAILCRLNKPLFSLFFPLLKQGRQVRLLGNDIGKGLASILSKKTRNNVELRQIAQDLLGWKYETIDKIEERKSLSKQSKSSAAFAIQQVEDKYECLLIVLKATGSKQAALKALEEMFDTTEEPEIVLSTIHKMKGREYDNIYYLQHLLPPHILALISESQQIQEKNLRYVAITRARHNLTYVTPAKLPAD